MEVKVDGVVNADTIVIPPSLQLPPHKTTKQDANTDANETFIVVFLFINYE